jgi:hypothetical protein
VSLEVKWTGQMKNEEEGDKDHIYKEIIVMERLGLEQLTVLENENGKHNKMAQPQKQKWGKKLACEINLHYIFHRHYMFN